MFGDVTKGIGFRRSFALFEELAEASQGFDTDFRQLGPAGGEFYLEQLLSRRMLFTRVRLTSPFHQLGSSPRGYRTFSLLAPGSVGFRWCGESVNSNGIVVMPEEGDFESVSRPGFELFSISFSNELLELVVHRDLKRSLGEVLGPGRRLCPHGGEMVESLRVRLNRLSGQIENGTAWYPDSREEEALAFLALSSFRTQESRSPREARSRRVKALRDALAIIGRDDPGRLAVEELVSRCGVSRRTLENAFQDGLGISPAAYLKARRLLALNRALLQADAPRMSVVELAGQHGFNHHGQLAADYNALFGELPSATLRRQRNTDN